jgi:hypothetical protein
MNELQFCYWLQGYFELGQASGLNSDQVQVIKDHLQLVFKKETPSYDFGSGSTWTNLTGNTTIANC